MNIELVRKIDRIHPYPAKFTVDMALEYIEMYSKPGDTLYDPFVGSGTSLLAASMLNRQGIGTDINHIAILIARFKLLHLSKKQLEELHGFIDSYESAYESGCRQVTPFYYKGIDHWFCSDAIMGLSYILSEIEKISDDQEKTFCRLVMSAIINTVSNQESDTRYAAIVKPDITAEKVAAVFIRKFRSILAVFEEYNELPRDTHATAVLLDSALCSQIAPENSVDLILTSPPYVNTYDYYLYHKHRMNWLGYDVGFSMEKEIGSRREFSSLKHNEEKFSEDLTRIFTECDKLLRPGGHVVLIIGDGRVAGKTYDAREHMIAICEPIGWRLIDYKYTLLDKTSRSFQQSYRTKGKKEHILVFTKGG